MEAQRDAASHFRENAAVDGDDEQFMEDLDLVDVTEEVIFQQAQENSNGRKQAMRNASIIFSHRETQVYKFRDVDLKPGTCVELREPFGNWKSQFVVIKSIWASRSDGSVIIRGLPYTRNRNLRGIVKKQLNEVSQILDIDTDDRRSDEIQGQVEFSPRDILQLRTLINTNKLWPNHVVGANGKTLQEQERQAPIVCRAKFCVWYRDARARRDNKPDHNRAYIRLREAEADEGKRESDKALRFEWRGKTDRGGSFKPTSSKEDQQYTFGDAFCSAGGTSHGAVMAGLKLLFGVDNCSAACKTWHRNFPDAEIYEQHIGDWIGDNTIRFPHSIDILHLSPPCQSFSPHSYMHASAGRINEPAEAAIFACQEIVPKARTRVITVEQTFGITHETYEGYLNSLIEGFTRHGHSVRWKIIPLVEYGLPQIRKRLIMFASCPGEQLPPWPPATHAQRPTGNQKPWVTEAAALSGLSRRDPLHDVAGAKVRDNQPRNGNVPFSKTVTGGGTQGVSHFRGRRDYTLREIACLQGFPTSHQFEGTKTQIKKQIGNAFPSCVAKPIYDHLIACLQQADGVQRARPARAPSARVEDLRSPAPRLVRQPQPVVLPQGLPAEMQSRINGDLTEEEAFELALHQSRSDSLPAAVVLPSVEEDRQYSPVSVVGPLLERMSIAPSDHRDEVPAENSSRSRSRTLGRSASPGPGRHPEAASQKRSLDSMHDGEVDEVMRKESPPKRERVHVGGDGYSNNGGVDDTMIPSRLARFVGPRRRYGAGVEEMWTF